jgi:phosphoglucosamine mutase
MTKLFGTDGMRGEAGKFPLDAATVHTVGASLASHLSNKLQRRPSIVIGRDTRESGGWLESALLEGIEKAGGVTHSAGVITTPGVAFLTRSLPADAGVVISASHNPYQDNGIKIFAPSGCKLDEATEQLIEADVKSETTDTIKTVIEPSIIKANETDLTARYLDFLANEIGHDLSLRGMKIAVDSANGAASSIARPLFERLGADVFSINDKPDGRNINRDCGSLHMERLQREVVETQADIGVALDGDADRALFVDANGTLVNGDGTLWVLANYLRDRNNLREDTVVATVMSNIGLELALKSRGIKLVRTDVGDKYVLEELLRLKASLGGEQSGHIIFPELSLAGDGLITALCLIRAIKETKLPLHSLTNGFQNFPQILVNVVVKEKIPFDEVETVGEAVQRIEKQLGSKGRLLLRYSGTEPLARVMLEGESQEEIEEQAAELAAAISKSIGA